MSHCHYCKEAQEKATLVILSSSLLAICILNLIVPLVKRKHSWLYCAPPTTQLKKYVAVDNLSHNYRVPIALIRYIYILSVGTTDI